MTGEKPDKVRLPVRASYESRLRLGWDNLGKILITTRYFQKYTQIWMQIYGLWPFVAEDFVKTLLYSRTICC